MLVPGSVIEIYVPFEDGKSYKVKYVAESDFWVIRK
jgi:hypothetical protein